MKNYFIYIALFFFFNSLSSTNEWDQEKLSAEQKTLVDDMKKNSANYIASLAPTFTNIEGGSQALRDLTESEAKKIAAYEDQFKKMNFQHRKYMEKEEKIKKKEQEKLAKFKEKLKKKEEKRKKKEQEKLAKFKEKLENSESISLPGTVDQSSLPPHETAVIEDDNSSNILSNSTLVLVSVPTILFFTLCKMMAAQSNPTHKKNRSCDVG